MRVFIAGDWHSDLHEQALSDAILWSIWDMQQQGRLAQK